MTKYIALLRGINVGGKTIKMAVLKELLEQEGFKNVITFIQSGNIIFDYSVNEERSLQAKISKAIKTKLNLEVSVLVLTKLALAKIIKNNPFIKDKSVMLDKLHVTFLIDNPQITLTEDTFPKDPNEQFALGENVIYFYCPNGYGTSKLTNPIVERKLKVSATTRNWKTTNKLLELAG